MQGCAHPSLDGPERMFGGLPPKAHALGRAFQLFLCIASRTASCSQRLTRRSLAGVHFDFSMQPAAFRRPVVMQLSPCLDILYRRFKLLAGSRAMIEVLARIVDEILLAEPAVRFGP